MNLHRSGLIVTSLIMATLLLGACMEWTGPAGFDEKFHTKTKEAFYELDDDTSEVEIPDRDDYRNINMVLETADTPEEKAVVELMRVLITENEGIVKDQNYPIAGYLEARNTIEEKMDITVYDFEFGEEE